MSSYTSKKLSFNNAEQFKEAFFEPEPTTIGYVFISKNLPWADEDQPDDIFDTVADEKEIWDNMFAAKKVTGNDVELVTEKRPWVSGSTYKQYDDTVILEDLLTTENGFEPMYVINSENNVYKCLSNNLGVPSTFEPTGKNISAKGIITTTDGYIWKYLYNVRPSNKFISDNWIPAPSSILKLEYDATSETLVDGEITTIVVENEGSGYIHSQIFVDSFETGCTFLTVANTNNLALNMTVSGTGVPSTTFITNIDVLNSRITLSSPTVSSGGGVSNTISVTTRVEVQGDGIDAVCVPVLNLNSGIGKINFLSFGKDYSFANVVIYGTGTNASARAILPPKFGHGFNSAKELGASNVMISMRIGEVDSTENGIISTETSFRQYGLLRDPYKYGEVLPANTVTSNLVISQTTNAVLIAGPNYELEEFVYQGISPEDSTFTGYVHAYTTNEVRLTNVRGQLIVGTPLKGTITNPTGRVVVTTSSPEFEPYSGDILYCDNVLKTQRTDGQAENLKFVVKF